jgi:hypothetical protein
VQTSLPGHSLFSLPCRFAAGAGNSDRILAPSGRDPAAVFHADFARIDPMSNFPGRRDA